MVRVKGGVASRRKHKKVVSAAKGYRGKRSTTFKMAKQAVMKAGLHSYVGRKRKKRDFRRLWITRISNALRAVGEMYSQIKNRWLHAKVEIDRKNLSELAINYPKVFEKIVAVGKKQK